MSSVMSFDSEPLGASLGVFVASPYTQRRVVELAMELEKDDCVQTRNGKLFGKIPLRDAFPTVTSAWRSKVCPHLPRQCIPLG